MFGYFEALTQEQSNPSASSVGARDMVEFKVLQSVQDLSDSTAIVLCRTEGVGHVPP